MRPASPYRVPGERAALVEPPPTSAATTPAEDNEAELTEVAYEDDSREGSVRLPDFIVLAIIGGLAVALVVVMLLAGPALTLCPVASRHGLSERERVEQIPPRALERELPNEPLKGAGCPGEATYRGVLIRAGS